MTIYLELSSRAASRATCRPTIPAPPRMRIVSSLARIAHTVSAAEGRLQRAAGSGQGFPARCPLRPARCLSGEIRAAAFAVSRSRPCRLANPLLLALRQVPALGDPLVRKPALAVERGHAAGAGGG